MPLKLLFTDYQEIKTIELMELLIRNIKSPIWIKLKLSLILIDFYFKDAKP